MDLGPILARFQAADVLRVAVELSIVLVLTLLALRVLPGTLTRLIERSMVAPAAEDTRERLSVVEYEKRRRTLQSLARNAIRIVVLVCGALAALAVFDIDLGPAIAGLGLFGLAIGLGTQNLVKDIVAGMFILTENQYAKGDVVTIAGATGTVEDLGLRRTILRDFDGTVHVVPNGLIGVTSNMTRVWARVVVDIAIKDPARVDEASGVIAEAGTAMAADPRWKGRLLAAPQVDQVKAASAAGVTLKVVGMVAAADRWDAAGEVRRRIVEGFAGVGIELGG
jgi:small conductance mechanosensitive channel